MSITKNQHFIPQMILRRHCMPFCVPQRKCQLWQYDHVNGVKRLVDPKEVCKSKNLYELRDDDGNILASCLNAIENGFSCRETIWNSVLRKVDSRLPLSDSDIAELYSLTMYQILRMPTMLNSFRDIMQDLQPELSPHAADRYAKICSFMGTPERPTKNLMIDMMVSKFANLYMCIGCTNNWLLLNGNMPYGFIRLDDNFCDFGFFAFPVSSHRCLIFTKGCMSSGEYADLPDMVVDVVNKTFFCAPGRFVYCGKDIFL